MEKTCLDTDFLIDILRKKEEPLKWLIKNTDKQLFTTTINLFEIFYGAYKSKNNNELKACEELSDTFSVVSLSKEAAKTAGKIASSLEREGKTIDFRDIMIASIAITENASLKTFNTKHFSRINGLLLA